MRLSKNRAALSAAFFVCAVFWLSAAFAEEPLDVQPESAAEFFASESEENFLALPDVKMVSILIPAECDRFLIGEHAQTSVERRYVRSFKVNKFETSYQLWFEIRQVAEKMGYHFENPGQEGSAGRRGRLPTERGKSHPVTAINWKDAIVWLNALSEICSLSPVYSFRGEVLRDSAEAAKCDLAEADWRSDGFRLLTEAEWEYAARKMRDGGFQRGDFPSGVLSVEQSLDRAGEDVAWFDANSSGTHPVGTAEKPNDLGLFDMAGNVLEFCWDWSAEYVQVEEGAFACGPQFGAERAARGGSWSPCASFILAGDRYSFSSDEAYNYLGFRFGQSVKEESAQDDENQPSEAEPL